MKPAGQVEAAGALSPEVREARELLIGAVSIPSLSGQEAALASWLTEWMTARGFTARVDEAGNAVGERGHGPFTVALLGHLDTVPGGPAVRLEGERLYGRGSVDAKGPLCAFLAAVAGLPAEVLAAGRFVVIGATEEEAPSSRGARHIRTVISPDAVLIGEPSGWSGLTLGYKGRLVVHVTVERPNFHSAGEGQSAADTLLEAGGRLREWAARTAGQGSGQGPGTAGIFDAVQVTAQAISSENDGHTQRASGVFGLRLPPRVSPQEAEDTVLELLGGPPGEWPGLHVTFSGHESAVRHPRDNALTRALRVAIREQGGQPVFKVKTGTSDMNVVAELWPVPTVAYGPGDSALDHTPNEHLDLNEYDRAVAVLRAALTRLVSPPPTPPTDATPPVPPKS